MIVVVFGTLIGAMAAAGALAVQQPWWVAVALYSGVGTVAALAGALWAARPSRHPMAAGAEPATGSLCPNDRV